MAVPSDLYHRQVQAALIIAEAMNTAADRETVLPAVLATLVDTLGYKGATLRMLDPEKRTLDLAAAHGVSDEYLAKGEILLANSVIDQQVLAGQIVGLQDVRNEPRVQYPDALEREGIRSLLALPLRVSHRTTGVLRVFTGELHEFGSEERAFLAGVANLAARAIANAATYSAFKSISRQVNSTLEAELVLKNLLRSLLEELNVKGAAVRLLGPRGQRLHLAAAEGLSQAYLNKGEIRIADSPVDRQVLNDNKPVVVLDVTAGGYQYPHEAEQEGIRSVLAVPLRLHETIIGVLRVYSAQPHRFSQEEIALVEAVADLGAIALENARLHQTLKEKYEAAREDWAGWFRYLSFS